MPIYSYECPDCAAVKDEFRRIDERNDPVACECGASMNKLIGGHRVIGDMEPYYDENLQTHIKSRQHRRDVMREQGVSEAYGKNWHTGRNNKLRSRH